VRCVISFRNIFTYINTTHALSHPANRAPSGRRRSLSGKRPGETGGPGVTPRGVAAPPGPPSAIGCRWLGTHHSSRLLVRNGLQGHLRSQTVLTKKTVLPPKRVAEASHIFLRDAHILPKRLSNSFYI
jgi:hypothetical protein